MTFNELYEYGMKSKPAKLCIPQELVQSLPRLERINGKIVVQFWYYYRNVSYPWQIDEPLYYAAFDIYENRLVEMKKISRHSIPGKSWLDLVTYSPEMREVKYLEHCAMLLSAGVSLRRKSSFPRPYGWIVRRKTYFRPFITVLVFVRRQFRS